MVNIAREIGRLLNEIAEAEPRTVLPGYKYPHITPIKVLEFAEKDREHPLYDCFDFEAEDGSRTLNDMMQRVHSLAAMAAGVHFTFGFDTPKAIAKYADERCFEGYEVEEDETAA
jgi:hypothetical protein